MGAIPQFLIINGPGLSEPLDLPPPVGQLTRKMDVVRDLSNKYWFKSGVSCYSDDLTQVGTVHMLRLTSQDNYGWVTLEQANILREWYDSNSVITISTNIVVPELSSVDFRFAYLEGQSSLVLTKAAADSRYWKYDMILESV